ncbi:Transporter associated domain protein [Entomobacter blattae]|uniref:Transporter associated domain protein n=1 Tax=Entomobacter blattae TaxID=2762277 RepID=A0A7H1NSB6_9PROT|nr:Transporter associated domain protein [Entomobacter blattae]
MTRGLNPKPNLCSLQHQKTNLRKNWSATVLERLRSSDIGLVLVLDEYGSFEGIVTAGDVFEAIVGGKKAQKDKKDQIQAHPIVADTFELEGFLPVDEIRANLDLAEEPPAYGSYHTLAGMILALLRRIPAVGDKVVFSGWLFEVTEMEGRKITKIKASRQILRVFPSLVERSGFYTMRIGPFLPVLPPPRVMYAILARSLRHAEKNAASYAPYRAFFVHYVKNQIYQVPVSNAP